MASSMSTLMLLNEFLPASALSLGCLVESLRNPAMDAYVPKEPLSQDYVSEVFGVSFETLLASSKSTRFHIALTRLLKSKQRVADQSQTALRSSQVTRYLLNQPKQVLKALCTNGEEAPGEARDWLNEGISNGNRIYLVVELHTVRDVELSRREERGHSSAIDATVPVSTIATQGLDVAGFGAVLDTGGGFDYQRAHGHGKRFSIEGESIFAVGVKRIKWESWAWPWSKSKQTIETADLTDKLEDKITWVILGQKRQREEADELISVDLADDLLAKNDVGSYGDNDDDDDAESDVHDLVKNSVEVDGRTYMMYSDDESGDESDP